MLKFTNLLKPVNLLICHYTSPVQKQQLCSAIVLTRRLHIDFSKKSRENVEQKENQGNLDTIK